MALERRNPLPVGRYWLDVFAPNAAAWSAFVAKNRAALRVTQTEHFEANAGGPARDFLIFEVSSPVPWDAKTFGFPSVAPSSVQGSDDTVTKPPPETGPDLPSLFGGITLGSGLALLVGVGVLIAGISAIRR